VNSVCQFVNSLTSLRYSRNLAVSFHEKYCARVQISTLRARYGALVLVMSGVVRRAREKVSILDAEFPELSFSRRELTEEYQASAQRLACLPPSNALLPGHEVTYSSLFRGVRS